MAVKNRVLRKRDGVPVSIPGGGVITPVNVNFREVESSNVEWVGWDKARNMYVKFRSGVMYVYLGVSRQRAVACAYYPSVGRYLNRRIKGHFDVVMLG